MKATKKQVNSSPEPTTNQELDHFTKTPEARALMTVHKRRSTNKYGRNQYTESIINNFVPYPLKYAIADALLKDNKTIQYVIDYTGLSKETVCRLKKGEIKLLNSVVDKVKEHENANITMLGNSILDRISEEDMQKASLSQKIISYSILSDNMLDKLESVDNK